MLGKSKRTYDGLIAKMENEVVDRFPAISKHINAIHIDNSKMSPMSADIKSAGLFCAVDSNKCTKEALPAGFQPTDAVVMKISDSAKAYIDRSMDSFIKSGMDEATAKKKVQDSLIPMMGYDPAKKQYIMTAIAPSADGKVHDSLLEQTSIPMWNIGWLTRII